MSKDRLKTNSTPEELTFISVENPGTGPLILELLSLKGTVLREIPFDDKNNIGTVCNMTLKGIDTKKTGYRLKSGDNEFMDPYACHVSGDEKWGKYAPIGRFDSPVIEEVVPLKEKKGFSDMVIYHLHVRGFTKGRNSGAEHRGTFEGVTEKIPYFRELGINSVELMPSYDFDEIIREKIPSGQEEAKREAVIKHDDTVRLNYWGYTKGCYFVPKNSFSAKRDGVSSFKDMVSELHRAGISVICDFYFENDLTPRYIVDVLRYWVINYGVDGFALFGSDIPAADILRDPYLKGTLFIFEHYPDTGRAENAAEIEKDRIAVLNSDFLYDNRRFLKSDADMLSRFASHLLSEGEITPVNYMASFNTLTMNDMVSYDRKHNEANGENNTDGTDMNFSWNCGVEGKSRRKAVTALRDRQIKNAFSYLLLSRGTPRIFMGDEFRNSQNGNNNPYCLDNSVTWLNWEDKEKNKETLDFVKNMIKLRLKDPVFRRSLEKKKGKYPETSFHGEMAWQAAFYDYFRHVGVLYAAKDLYYCAFNMHWQEQKLALPKLEKDTCWKTVTNTNTEKKESLTDSGFLYVPPRSVVILKAE